ncbi:hypothetical protein HDU88_003194 [Geranomyces variabilis]|nr:hypothetical protein HDU88_003194 [Geranomyces variabilis]
MDPTALGHWFIGPTEICPCSGFLPGTSDIVARLPKQLYQQPAEGVTTEPLEPYRNGRGGDETVVLVILTASASESRFEAVKGNVRDYVAREDGPFQLIAVQDGMSTSTNLSDPRVVFPATSSKEYLLTTLDRIQYTPSNFNCEGFTHLLHMLSVDFRPATFKRVVIFCADAPIKRTITQPLTDVGIEIEILNAYESGKRVNFMRLLDRKIELGLAMVLPDNGKSAFSLKSDVELLVKIRAKNVQPGKVLEIIFDETPYFAKASLKIQLGQMPAGGTGFFEYQIRLLCKLKNHALTSWHDAIKLLPPFLNIRVLRHGVFSKPKPMETDVPGFCLQPNTYQPLALSSADSDHVTLGCEEFNLPHFPFRFYDSRGISECNYKGDELELLCNGQMPLDIDWAIFDRKGDGTCVSSTSLAPYVASAGFVETNKQPDVVLFLLSPTVLDDTSQMAKYKAIERTGRQVVVAISRMDTAIDYREREDYINSCKRLLSTDNVLPLINYTTLQTRRRFELDQFLAAVWIALHEAGSDFRARRGRRRQLSEPVDHIDMPALGDMTISRPPREVRPGGSAHWSAELLLPPALTAPAAPAMPPNRSSAEISELYRHRALSSSSAELRQPSNKLFANQLVATDSLNLTPPPSPRFPDIVNRNETRCDQMAAPHLQSNHPEFGNVDGHLPSYRAVQAEDGVYVESHIDGPAPRIFQNVVDTVPMERGSLSGLHSRPLPPNPTHASPASVASSVSSGSPSHQNGPQSPQPVPPGAITEGEFFDRALQISCIARDIRVQQDINLVLMHKFSRRGIQYQQAFLKAYAANMGDRDAFLVSLQAATENMIP